MRLYELVRTSGQVAATGSRLEKISLVAGLLKRVAPDEIPVAVAYLSGRLRQGKSGIGYAALRAASSGAPAESPSLSLSEVDDRFDRIAAVTGPGSSRTRGQLLRELFALAVEEERNFLFRLVLGELRQGSLEGIMVEAIARAAEIPGDTVRRAVMVSGGLENVGRRALEHGEAGLAVYDVRLLQPVQPMLAQTADDVAGALEMLGNAALEYKLDGARVQVHKSGDEVRVFTRKLNDVTGSVPELVEIARRLPAEEAILDGEALAMRADGLPHPFQVTMRRFGRKLDVAEMRRMLPLAPYFFDCLYLDGTSLIGLPYEERAAALDRIVPADARIRRLVTQNPDQAESFAREALEAGHEGIMAKSLDAAYEAGSRGKSWLKVKQAFTLDLVVLAAEWGHGRRHGWLSNLHLGARDPQSGQFVMLGKTFKGLTDEMLAWQTRKLLELEVSRDSWTVYVRPEVVVEVAFNGIQESPQYPGGLALRFARIKSYRPDKSPDQVDTMEAVQTIHRLQGGAFRQ